MKFLLLLLAVFVLLWMLRGSWRRVRRPPDAKPPAAQSPEAPQSILACAECGLHLPRDEALPGRGGVFCSAAHRAAFEQAHPDR